MSKEFKLATEWDVTKEKIKMLLLVIGGFLYGYFVILGKSIFWYSEMVGGINRPQFTIKIYTRVGWGSNSNRIIRFRLNTPHLPTFNHF